MHHEVKNEGWTKNARVGQKQALKAWERKRGPGPTGKRMPRYAPAPSLREETEASNLFWKGDVYQGQKKEST